MSNKNPVYNPNPPSETDPAKAIEQYEKEFVGKTTDVKEIPYPEPDRQWFHTLTRIIAGYDADTFQFGNPDDYKDAESDVIVVHESNGHQVLTYVGDETQTIATTKLGDNLDFETIDSGISITFDDGSKRVINVTNKNGISLSTTVEGDETELRVVNNKSNVNLEYVTSTGDVINLVEVEKTPLGENPGKPIYSSVRIPSYDMTKEEIEADDSIKLAPNEAVYLTPDREGAYFNEI